MLKLNYTSLFVSASILALATPEALSAAEVFLKESSA